MIILDNSVLSAFRRLKLLSNLNKLISSAIISKEVFNEYSKQWQKKIPNWIKIKQPRDDIILESGSVSLSKADLSLIRLALEHKIPIATDDKSLRQFAKNLDISIVGSLGLLKSLYYSKIIKTKKEYLSFLESLQEDIFISNELMKWALEEP
ncbi:hypothetical protein LCGC14_1307490 [marine sediment metagenome]|uniref:PIN domain-containing protein n=1 Tax=marine sediment metagenome TaxID=412755 RepID=A0A0F9NQS0_9ZZZZ